MTKCSRCIEDCKLLEEKVTSCPPHLTAEDFERFMRKLAVHAHANRDPDDKPMTIDYMEIGLTEAVVEALPAFYVSLMEYEPERKRQTGLNGSYTIKAKIPQELLYGTVERLGLWTRETPEESEGDGLTDA